MRTYYALVHKDVDSAYGVTFPDLPGCFAAADAETNIHEAAQEALVLYAQGGEEIAAPRSIPQLQADADIKAELSSGAVLLAVPLIVVERKARYSVMLDVDLVAGVDQKAKTMGVTRSEFVSLALRDQLKAVAGAAFVTAARTSRQYTAKK